VCFLFVSGNQDLDYIYLYIYPSIERDREIKGETVGLTNA
jgi:hypothetical protein